MRFPWLQVDADFIAAHAGDLGSHLGISRREAIGLAVDLWTWALARARDDAPPDGVVTGTGPVPDRLLAGSVGWTGPVEQLTAALIGCGLAVRIENGYRLTGFSRYKSTWEKNRRRTGEKPDRNRAGTGEEPARKTQTHIEASPPPASAEAREELRLKPLVAKRLKAKPEKPQPDPRHAPLVAQLVEATPGYTFAGGGDAMAVTHLLALADAQSETAGERAPAEVLRRWRIGWAWRWGNGEAPCQSLRRLVQFWNECRSHETAPPAREKSRAHGGSRGPVMATSWGEGDLDVG